MLILTIRTDKPEAEIGLYDNHEQLAYKKWEAHRALAETIHKEINELSKTVNKDLKDIEGIVCYQGPGSFTGLRIGLSVGNALAYSLSVPVVATANDWIEQGIKRLLAGESDKVALPEYGHTANITKPRK